MSLILVSTWSILYLDEWLGGFGGLCDFSVSPSPFGLDFGTLDFGTLDFGLTTTQFLKAGGTKLLDRTVIRKRVYK